MARQHLTRPRTTSWAAVLGGWLASVGAAALIAPAVATLLNGTARSGIADLASVVPVVVGLIVAYLIGGYVAGSMAAQRTSWHGMLTAFFGLFVVLAALLIGVAAERGYLAGTGIRSLADVFPGVQASNLQTIGDAATFGAILGFLATIFAGWLGGLLAPTRYVPVPVEVQPGTTNETFREPAAREPAAREPEAREPEAREPAARVTRPFRVFPATGRKGGEPSLSEERAPRVGPDDERERPREVRAEPE
ncbi:MAG: hypothetical protein ABR525_05025 [Candidatus Limnocylindria bacterium]